jgi:hypothetical protein
MLNVEKLGIFESREQLSRLSYIFALTEPMGDASPLLDEMSNALLDLGLHTIELSVQLSEIFHLALPFVLGKNKAIALRLSAREREPPMFLPNSEQ